MERLKNLILILPIFGFQILLAQSEPNFLLKHNLISTNQNDSLLNYCNRYEKIKTDRQFLEFYNDLTIFKKQLSKMIDEKVKSTNNDSLRKDLSVFFKVKIKIFNVLENEVGNPFYLEWNNELLLQKAMETEGKNDEDFMNIVYIVYGKSGESGEYSVPFWIHKRSYVSISSRLGDYSNFKFYKKLNTAIKVNKMFRDQLSVIEEVFKSDLIIYSAFDYKKHDVIKELRKIKRYDSNLKPEINKYIEDINSSSTFQFDCNMGNCKFEY